MFGKNQNYDRKAEKNKYMATNLETADPSNMPHTSFSNGYTRITLLKFAICQSETVSAVLVYCDIKSLTCYG